MTENLLKTAIKELQAADQWLGKVVVNATRARIRAAIDAVAQADAIEDGPDLPPSYVYAWKKPLLIKAWHEGLTTRALGRVFDVSHETAAEWTRGLQRTQT